MPYNIKIVHLFKGNKYWVVPKEVIMKNHYVGSWVKRDG